jgi:hypothetical protein
MSSSRLAKLRNQNGAPPLVSSKSTKVPVAVVQKNSNINPLQILEWHEVRLKDLKNQFEMINTKLDNFAQTNISNNVMTSDAGQLLEVNDILEKLQKVNNRVDGLEILTKNIKDDYLNFKNGDTKNRVELIVNDRVNQIKKTENVVQETKDEIKEMRATLAQLDIEPTQKDVKAVKTVTFDLPDKTSSVCPVPSAPFLSSVDVVGFDSGSSGDLIGAPI